MLSRIAFPAAEATFGARWAARAGPVRGPPAATKFEDYTVLQIVVSSGACTRGATKIVGLDRACGGKSAVLGGFCGQTCGRWTPYGRRQRRQVRVRIDLARRSAPTTRTPLTGVVGNRQLGWNSGREGELGPAA